MTMQRSKNRIREHGDHWKPVDCRNIAAFNGAPGILFECDTPTCSWSGWVPVEDAKALGAIPKCFQPKS